MSLTLEWVKTIGNIVLSWPIVVLVLALVFKTPLMKLLERLSTSEVSRAKLGPVELELTRIAEKGQAAVDTLDRVNAVMAESRLLELEITEGMFSTVFTEEQRQRMRDHIGKLRRLTLQGEQAEDGNH